MQLSDLTRVALACLSTALIGCGGGDAVSPPPPPPVIPAPPAGLVRLPGDAAVSAASLFSAPQSAARWCVYRAWPAETLHAFRDCAGGAGTALPFTRGRQGEVMLVNSAADDDNLWLLTYDARENIPSGRIPGQLFEGIDVWRFSRGSNAEPQLIAAKLPLGGFDNFVYAVPDGGAVTVCATNRCYTVSAAGAVSEWETTAVRDYEFVELLAGGAPGTAVALMRTHDAAAGSVDRANFHFAIARLTPAGAQIEAVPRVCVPFRLRATALPGYECVASRADVVELLRSELARMPHTGLMDFGTSNSEGRVPWSQVYYLQGLLQLTGGRTTTLAAAADWTTLRGRVRDEVNLLAMRVLRTEGLTSRRYSMQRTPVTFALHLGRAARTLSDAQEFGFGSADITAALATLRQQLRALAITVEVPMTDSSGGVEFATLGYRRGSDFWCDGANVPYNYISGYVDGVMATTPDAADLDRVTTLMRPLLTLEPLATSPIWEYWWGTGRNGWSAGSGVSMNTPAYVGFVGAAHTTYRSMDAAALLRLRQRRAGAYDAAVDTNFRRLVAEGALLPWVNEALATGPGPESLDAIVAARYARSAAPWEIQAQVWALEQLARNL